jgi:hypothetical protein
VSRVESLNRRYAASAALVHDGVEVDAIGDPNGARFNKAVRALIAVDRADGPGLWDDIVGASKALRWRLLTQPQPIEFNGGLADLADAVRVAALRLRGATGDQALLDELTDSAVLIAETDPVVGGALLRNCREAGVDSCVVVAANKVAQTGLQDWLRQFNVQVSTPGELQLAPSDRDQAYVVGPPRFYRSSLVTAPATNGVTFLVPSWFGDRSIPSSAIAAYAEGAIRIEARLFTEGDTSEPLAKDLIPEEDEELYLPGPIWRARDQETREPTSDEVVVHKVLLSGGLAMWLDDGERIRTLDPAQPAGERVTYSDVAAVSPGTYLLVRKGTTERGVLYQAAIARLGQRGAEVEAAQSTWKRLLGERLQSMSYRGVVRDLRAADIKAADRARAWTDPNFIRPHRDQDLERLLTWLRVPIQPTFGYAGLLRKMLYQVSAEIGKQLEAAVASADLSALQRTGYIALDVEADGFRGILATRVLAISPYPEIVSRHESRVPFEDRSGQWLE